MFIAMNAIVEFIIIACLVFTAYGLPSSQITGGIDALDGAYPYQVSLRRDPIDITTHFCGGAIISERYILTSAQCIYRFTNPYDVYVAFGSNYLDNSTTYIATNLIVHAGYNNALRINDIGLVETSAIDTPTAKPIALPAADYNFDGHVLFATGWGSYYLGGRLSNELQEIILKEYSYKLCSKYKHVKETHICTFTEQGEGMCHGDEGGPLVAENVLVGLMSYSYGLCGAGAPDVFTRVTSYRSWIKYYTGI